MITDNFLESNASELLYPGHVQTFMLELMDKILKVFKNCCKVSSDLRINRTEIFEISDGGTVTVDHFTKRESYSIYNDKILLVIPGFTSNSDEYYIKSFVDDFAEEFDCQVMNLRGFSGIKLTSPHMISTHCYRDVREYIEHLCNTNPDKNIFAVGFSFGGMLLIRSIGTNPDTLPKNLIGGCGICYPPCLMSVKLHVEKQLNGFYSKFSAKRLKQCFMENVEIIFDENNKNNTIHTEKNKIIEEVNSVNHVHEFDDIFTTKVLKFESVESYYNDSKINKYLENIKIPFLSVFTQDDPIIPHDALPFDILQSNNNLTTIISKKGGHLGFFTGIIPKRWIDVPIKTFIKTVDLLYE
jgi:predicted alpha/beta-fold hydrolase